MGENNNKKQHHQKNKNKKTPIYLIEMYIAIYNFSPMVTTKPTCLLDPGIF